VRFKVIISGAVAALALATLTANAGNAAHSDKPGSVQSLVAGTVAFGRVDRDAFTLASRTTSTSTAIAVKPAVAARPAAPRLALSAGCQAAINNLKALHQADAAEDAAERAAQRPVSLTALQAERAEDLAELQQWRNALTAAGTACLPQRTAACQTAIANLQAMVQAQRTTELNELRTISRVRFDWLTDFAGLRTALTTLATACGNRD
jgi:hypothetical protein